jgi:hypothetical protein
MNQRDRITQIAQEEFPGSIVVFDEEGQQTMLRWRIETGSGTILSRAFPHYHPSEIEDKTNSQLRVLLRGLCGISE